MQGIAGEFVGPNPSPARFPDLNSSCLIVPGAVLLVLISKRHQLGPSSLSRQLLSKLPWYWLGAGKYRSSGRFLACLPAWPVSFADSVWAGKAAGVASLEMRSWLREEQVSQTLSSQTGGPHTPSQQEQGGILSQVQAGPWEGPLLTSHCLPFPQPDTQLQVDMVRVLIEKAALELQQKLTSHPPESRFPDKELCRGLVK